ncbi:MAG: putative DNA binding domain-containing protein [Tannerella sp.]|jgi:ATP-dependent DNA helicase RecG|nr:putative DNA binding domain-containing protein [Tannerella sp.]
MFKENKHIEWKSGFNEEAMEALSAFANSKGGKVVVGMNDKGIPVRNFDMGTETIQQWINEFKTKTQPSIIADYEIVQINGVDVVELSVPEFPVKPVAFRGRYYRRVNNSTHQMSIDEVADMHLQTKNTSWDYYPRPDKNLKDISLDKVEKVIALIEKRNPNLRFDSPVEFLSKNELLLEDDKITNGCYLLFSSDFNLYSTIQMGHFQDDITIKDDVTLQSDIVSQVEDVMSFIRKHINKEIIITDTQIENIQRWQYPLDAIREIVLNMIVHRDYRDSGHSIIKIFKDHISFYNPGTLMPPLTIEDLLSNQYISKPRNRQIASVIKDVGWIEKYGTGIRRIRKMFQEYGSIEPEFKMVSGCFAVTAFASDYKDEEETKESVPENVPESVPENVPENRLHIIIDMIKNDGFVSIPELSKVLNVNHKTIKRDIEKLKTKGMIERIGANRGGYWKIKT